MTAVSARDSRQARMPDQRPLRCLILGGRGFLGSHLCDAIVGSGHSARVFDRPKVPAPENSPGALAAEFIEGDFANPRDLDEALEGIDVVFHLVSTTLPKTSNDNPVYDLETNVVGTMHMLEAARRNAVRKVVFSSSGGTVYGDLRQVPDPESHPTDPECSYGIGKLTIEKYLHLYHTLHGVDYCILRMANPYGPRQRATGVQGAATVFLHKAMAGETLEIWGDGSVVRDYLYVDDAVDALCRAMTHVGDRKLFNIGSGVGHSLNEVISSIETVLSCEVRRRHLPGRPFDVPTNVLDIALAREHLGWQPSTALMEGLTRTVEWIRRSSPNLTEGPAA